MLKRIILSALVLACALVGSQARADEWVNGYRKANGAWVAGYWRSTADGNFQNNWSTKPNVNPYTGQMGTQIAPSNSLRTNYQSRPSNYQYRGSGVKFGN